MIVLGIIGTPAGGKSTVARMLGDLGAAWIDADKIAREVLEDDAIERQVIEHFGPSITHQDGRINRSLLASAVFGDDEAQRQALRYLESVVHPPTRTEITSQLVRAAKDGFIVAVLDVPLLLESNWDVCCDEIWSVDSPRSDRLKRSQERGWDADELARRESNQLAISEKNRLSTHLIMNDSTLLDLHRIVIEHWNRFSRQEFDSRANFSFRHCLTDLSPRSRG
tara:strand:- start:64699 stop:65370 length:672 start_codon:yes stop_codon:yes gene_type:complete